MTTDPDGKPYLHNEEQLEAHKENFTLDKKETRGEPRPKVVPIKVPPVVPLRPVRVSPKRKTKGSENQGNVN